MSYSIGLLACLLAMVSTVSGRVIQTSNDEQLRSKVEHFDIREGFARIFAHNFVDKFIELGADQRKEIDGLKKRYYVRARSIIDQDQSAPGLPARYDQLVKLREKQNDEIRKVLLPEQIERLESYQLYSDIKSQGFANSLVNGSLVTLLRLTDAERIEVNKAVEKASDEYRDTMTEFQKKAIERLRKSLPVEKQEKLAEYLRPLLASNGTLWKTDLSMFDTKQKSSHWMFIGRAHISSFDSNSTKKDK